MNQEIRNSIILDYIYNYKKEIAIIVLIIVILEIIRKQFIYNRVNIYTYDFMNKRLEAGIGKIIRNKNIYLLVINEKIADKSESGKFEIWINESFVVRNKNRNLLITINDKQYDELVRRVIRLDEKNYIK